MNAKRYRIVFNRVRGLFMAVAEFASAHGNSAGNTPARDARQPSALDRERVLAKLRPAVFAVLLALGAQLGLVSLARAQIVAYKPAPASQQATVLAAGNGVPMVNIQTPGAAGVSRNTYSQFDVGVPGAILNNSRTNAQTQLGGWVEGNPWLAGGSARVILNEVVSSNPSALNGYVEVAGSAAQVVIANPAGISCNGCGFVNASRATLTTGTPVMNGDALEGYRVSGGTIRIEGAGMDASRVGYTDLIARAAEVNAGLWAQTLKVTAGANTVDADNSQATPIAPASGASPAFAIDVAQLGGMYAGKIILVGTEAGVGVRNAGYIGASAGEVVLTAGGKLIQRGSLSAEGNASIAVTGVENSGTLYARGKLDLGTPGEIANTGSTGAVIAAGGDVTLSARRIDGDSKAMFAAGLNADGSLGATGNLTLAASEQLGSRGQHAAGGKLAISARQLDLSASRNSAQNIALTARSGDLDLSGANTVAAGTLTAQAAQKIIHSDARSHAGQLDLTARTLDNRGGELVQTGSGDTALALSGNFDNRNGRFAANSRNLELSAQSFDNTSGRIEHAGAGTLALNAHTFAGSGGHLYSSNVGLDSEPQ